MGLRNPTISNKQAFLKGMHHGFPIGIGYFAGAFTIGIAAGNSGFSLLQTTAMSALVCSGAGQYAGILMAASGASYLQEALIIFVTNARYMIMSFSLVQKMEKNVPLWQRLLTANYVTDEIFAMAASSPGTLNPFYMLGIASITSPCWIIGSGIGSALGNILPVPVISALSVGLFGMFLALIIPPARHSKTLLIIIFISMLSSLMFTVVPLVSNVPKSLRVIILTVVLSFLAAVLFPVDVETSYTKENAE